MLAGCDLPNTRALSWRSLAMPATPGARGWPGARGRHPAQSVRHAPARLVAWPLGFASALPEPAERNGTERTSAGSGRAEALERVAVRRQHSGFRSPFPYFHNGFAADLDAAVDFYDQRFGIKFTKQEKSDLVAFLRSL
jgi:hypothetical protein